MYQFRVRVKVRVRARVSVRNMVGQMSKGKRFEGKCPDIGFGDCSSGQQLGVVIVVVIVCV